MGLDVYLTKCDNLRAARAVEEEYERISNLIWKEYPGEYKDLTDEQKDEARARCDAEKERLGLGGWGEHPEILDVQIDDAVYPEHYFKIGYFRSSYNGTGINRVLSRYGLPDLYWIFQPNDEYEVFPNWNTCLSRATDLLAQFEGILAEDAGKFDVFWEGYNAFHDPNDYPTSENEALEIYLQEFEDRNNMNWYSNIRGQFIHEGAEVVGLLPGKGGLGTPGMYVVIKRPADDLEWYKHALEIVVRTIEHVLAQPDKDKYFLQWSS